MGIGSTAAAAAVDEGGPNCCMGEYGCRNGRQITLSIADPLHTELAPNLVLDACDTEILWVASQHSTQGNDSCSIYFIDTSRHGGYDTSPDW